MNRRTGMLRGLALLLACAAAVLALAWWWPEAPPPIQPSGTTAEATCGAAAAGASLPEPGAVSPTAADRTEREAAAPLTQGFRGRVLAPSGEPVGGAEVAVVRLQSASPRVVALQRALGRPPQVLSTSTTAADGSFAAAVPAQAVGADLALSVRARAMGQVQLRHRSVQAGEWQGVGAVQLPTGQLVHGTVRAGPAGAPVAGASVHLAPASGVSHPVLDARLPSVLATVTDAEGRWEFAHVTLGNVDVLIRAEGHASELLLHQAVQAEGPLVLDVVLRPEARVRGRVVDADGRGVADAHVQASGIEPAGLPPGTARSDAAGAFEVAGLAQGTYRVTAAHQLHGSSEPLDVTTGGSDVELRLPGLGSAWLVVTGPDDEPVSTVRVRVLRHGGPGRPAQLASDEGFEQLPPAARIDGAWRLDGIGKGEHVVEVHAAGRAPAFSGPFTAARGELAPRVAVRLPPAARLRGTVLGSRGEPVAGAIVQLGSVRRSGDPAAALLQAVTVEPETERAGRSAADGSFELADLAGGTYQLVVVHPEFASRSIAPIALTAGEAAAIPPVQLERGAVLSGSVLLDGRPVAGARVLLGPGGATAANWPRGRVVEVATDADGRWRLAQRVPHGSWTLRWCRPEGIDPVRASRDLEVTARELVVAGDRDDLVLELATERR